MNVSLPDDLVEFVKAEVAEGGYGNQSDVVRDGLRLLRGQKQKHAALTRPIEQGRADIEAGRTKPLTTELLRGIATRVRQRSKR